MYAHLFVYRKLSYQIFHYCTVCFNWDEAFDYASREINYLCVALAHIKQGKTQEILK